MGFNVIEYKKFLNGLEIDSTRNYVLKFHMTSKKIHDYLKKSVKIFLHFPLFT